MANSMYYKGKDAFLSSELRWASACTFGVALVASPYSFDKVVDDFYDDIAAANRVASAVLSSPTSSDGAADATDVTFSSISGSNVFYVVIFHWTTNEATSELLAYYDTATGLPLTPNGGDINLVFDSGSIGLFEI